MSDPSVPRRPVIGILGAAEASPAEVAHARTLGALVAGKGWVVLTGGRPAGVMAAAIGGAREVPGSLTVGVLPHAEEPVAAGVDLAVRTDLGNGRNNINVLTSTAVVACGVTSAGTASEVALALKNGRPVVLLGCTPEAVAFFRSLEGDLLHLAVTPAEAIDILDRLGIRRGPPWPV